MSSKNFPGDSECYAGLVQEDELTAHVCLDCNGNGCKPKRVRRDVRERAAQRLLDLSGSTVFPDQRGRAVFVNIERGTAFVVES